MPRELGRILALYRRTSVTGGRERARRWLSNLVGFAVRQDCETHGQRGKTLGQIGQSFRSNHSMPSLQYVPITIVGIAAVLAYAPLAEAQNSMVLQGGQYPIAGSAAGDQMRPDLAISPSGGYLVWQDNMTDGDGLGISAQRLNATLSGSLS